MTPKVFFRLLVATILLAGVTFVVVAAFPGNISEDWRTLSEWNGDGGFYERLDPFTLQDHGFVHVAMFWLLALLAVLQLSAYVGLVLFWRPARIATLLLTVLYVIATPWAGLVVLLPFEAGLWDLSMLCTGAVIALSYTSPIKDYFEATQSG